MTEALDASPRQDSAASRTRTRTASLTLVGRPPLQSSVLPSCSRDRNCQRFRPPRGSDKLHWDSCVPLRGGLLLCCPLWGPAEKLAH